MNPKRGFIDADALMSMYVHDEYIVCMSPGEEFSGKENFNEIAIFTKELNNIKHKCIGCKRR